MANKLYIHNMSGMDVEGSWKGKIWLLYFIWTGVIAMVIVRNEYMSPVSGLEWFYLIAFIAGTILWLIGTYVLVKILREIFKQ